MWKVTLKGIWAKKVRFLLTGIAVMLGVAFISGTFVLTATISNTFDGLFSDIYQHTDAVVRAKETFSGDFGAGRGTISPTLLPTVRKAPGRRPGRRPGAGAGDHRRQEGRRAREQRAGRADVRLRVHRPTGELSTIHVVEGHGPRAPDEVVIDKKSADDAGYKPGDTVPVVTKAGRNDYHAHRHREVRHRRQPARRDHRRVHARDRVARARHARASSTRSTSRPTPACRRTRSSPTSAPRSKGAPDTANVEVISGERHHQGESEQPEGQPLVLQHVPAHLRRRRAARRLVHHLQHVLDHRGPARP